MTAIAERAEALIGTLQKLGSCLVAYSGGVDSAVVARAAVIALGSRAQAATSISPALPQKERESARELAAEIGIRQHEILTSELQRPGYTVNAPDRCFHCKTELYTHLRTLARELDCRHIVNGTNADDQLDYRPGLQAARDFEIVSPLAALNFHKPEVRELAKHWRISAADKLAAPCLASRIAYGESVTPERLRMIEQAEAWLHDRNWLDVRVRYHAGDLARIEIPVEKMANFLGSINPADLVGVFRQWGFKFVTLDLAGRQSGSLNVLVPLEILRAT